jgi:hypothetical protein
MDQMNAIARMASAVATVVLSTGALFAQDGGMENPGPGVAAPPAMGMAAGVAAGALARTGDLLQQAPAQLDGLLADAGQGHAFETEKSCLAHLQLAAQFAALTRNIMPFSEAWTLEDERGPVVKLRTMFSGERVHVELSCDGTVMRAEDLPWGEGSPEARRLQLSTLDAGVGAFFILDQEGAFDEDAAATEGTGPGVDPGAGTAPLLTGEGQ